ncbi:MAG: trypsin-like peptidase domain-containing protein, partial [Candidatus Sulfotelmatobacter sp.]
YMAAVLLLVAATSAQNAPSANKGRHLDIPAISREANGSIVSIVMSDKDGHPIAQGSGFLISKDGHVVTNYHVIRNGSSAVIKFPDGAFFAADGVLVSDKNRDVAIIKVHGNGFKALTLGDSDRLEVGEEVVAIGNPLSLESTVSNGIVSAIRTVEDEGGKFLQITAPISPGSSGGPLFNMAGKVVGITTSHIKGGENLNFAIPINDVKPMLQVQLPSGYEDAKPIARAFPDEPEPETVTPEQSTGPSLADTLQWMVESSADGVQYHEEYSPPVSGFLLSSFHIMTQDSSCHAFTMVSTIIYQQGTKSGANRFFVKFDLGAVDPDSIHQNASGGIVFSATDNQHRISVRREMAEDVDRLNSGRLISGDDSATGDDNFLISDDNYRSRLQKAFKHAVILCGGKPSRF